MHRALLLIALLLVSPVAFGDSRLAAVHRAAELLGPAVWSQVLRIENETPHPDYSRTVYATAFELGGLLWFYTPANGTQSLSLHHNNLSAERANLGPLLRAIHPGFVRHRVLTPAVSRKLRHAREPLPQGCFIESHAALRERLEYGEPLVNARLLTFYVSVEGRRQGHTVLVYETSAGAFVLDPASADRLPRPLGGVDLGQPRDVATLIRPDLLIAQARWVPGPLLPPASTASGGATLRHAHADKAQ